MPDKSNLTIHQFRVFTAIVRTGSLTQAAITLNIPQPSISRLIARLEREVGTPLFDRFNSGVTLTAAGERFHENALQAIHYHDLAIEEARAARGLLIGDVRIAAPDSVGGILFAPLVQGFRSAHSQVRLRTIASQSTEIPKMLAAGTIDIGIVADTHALPTEWCTPLFREELYLVGPNSASLLHKQEIPLNEITDVPLVLNAMPGGLRALIDDGFRKLGILPQVEIEVDANNALLELLVEGAGFSLLPYSLVASERTRTPLGDARVIDPCLTRTLYIITAANRPMSSVLREAVRRIRAVVQQEAERARWFVVD